MKYLILFVVITFVNCQIRNPIPSQLHECSVDELSLLKDVFEEIRSEGVLRYYGQGHARHFSMAHNDPYHFFTFHGQMIRDIERLIRKKDSRIREIPVWNMTVIPLVPTYFTALTSDWSEIIRPRPPNIRLPAMMANGLRNIRYDISYIRLINYCSAIHNDVHNWYGGTFGSPFSPFDPMFWFFHKFWDEVYIQWTQFNNLPILSAQMSIPAHPSTL